MEKCEFNEKVRDFKRELVADLLKRCTEKQREFFNKMYGSIETIKENKMRHAYYQCRRTVEKNDA